MQCPSCSEITESRSIDVQEIDAASNTGVDNVREAIIASVGIAPARDRYKIFIIDEVHMLSGAAFNALLKTLEEPPPRVVFIMATTEKHKVPETILSRCQQFEFRTIATAKILERLKLIAKAEKISIPDDALREIARTGEGSMRDAQSALDQVISFAGDEDQERRRRDGARRRRRRHSHAHHRQHRDEQSRGSDYRGRRHRDARSRPAKLLSRSAGALPRSAGDEGFRKRRAAGIGGVRTARAEAAGGAVFRIRSGSLLSFAGGNGNKLRAATQPRYQLEVGIVKLMELRGVETIGEILQRLEALESGDWIRELPKHGVIRS